MDSVDGLKAGHGQMATALKAHERNAKFNQAPLQFLMSFMVQCIERIGKKAEAKERRKAFAERQATKQAAARVQVLQEADRGPAATEGMEAGRARSSSQAGIAAAAAAMNEQAEAGAGGSEAKAAEMEGGIGAAAARFAALRAEQAAEMAEVKERAERAEKERGEMKELLAAAVRREDEAKKQAAAASAPAGGMGDIKAGLAAALAKKQGGGGSGGGGGGMGDIKAGLAAALAKKNGGASPPEAATEASAINRPEASAYKASAASGDSESGGGGGGVAIKDMEEYKPYFKMLKMGLPKGAAQQKMIKDGKDPAILDMDPEKPLPSAGGESLGPPLKDV
jgi:hypothetical protein